MENENNLAPIVWFCGLSGAGKTTLAVEVYKMLSAEGIVSVILDADKVRKAINNDLGYSESDRMENIRRAAGIANLLSNEGIITLNAYITPTHKMQELARNIAGIGKFILIYINAPLAVCEKRDTKGLYMQARLGKITEFTGVSAPFETPLAYDLELKTDSESVETCAKKIVALIKEKINYRNSD
jgi:adenylylsulfate kinase